MEVAYITGIPISAKEEEKPPIETAAAAGGPVSNTEEGIEEPEIPVCDSDKIPVWDSDDDGGIVLKTRPELEELHIARLKTIFQLDPKKNLMVPTRFCSINIAGFDLDKECEYTLQPFHLSPFGSVLIGNVETDGCRFQFYLLVVLNCVSCP
jgi:hypothetical protein